MIRFPGRLEGPFSAATGSRRAAKVCQRLDGGLMVLNFTAATLSLPNRPLVLPHMRQIWQQDIRKRSAKQLYRSLASQKFHPLIHRFAASAKSRIRPVSDYFTDQPRCLTSNLTPPLRISGENISLNSVGAKYLTVIFHKSPDECPETTNHTLTIPILH